jgi:hypothetical protein
LSDWIIPVVFWLKPNSSGLLGKGSLLFSQDAIITIGRTKKMIDFMAESFGFTYDEPSLHLVAFADKVVLYSRNGDRIKKKHTPG